MSVICLRKCATTRQQVLAFRSQADQLAEEARLSEEAAEELRAQLRKQGIVVRCRPNNRDAQARATV